MVDPNNRKYVEGYNSPTFYRSLGIIQEKY